MIGMKQLILFSNSQGPLRFPFISFSPLANSCLVGVFISHCCKEKYIMSIGYNEQRWEFIKESKKPRKHAFDQESDKNKKKK